MREMRMPRYLVLVAIAASSLMLAGCATKKINSVLADPSEYRDRDVTLSGTVSQSFGALQRGAYLLDDGTGKLWVVTDSGTPRQSARVKVKGRIREGFNLGSLGNIINVPGVSSGLVLVESDRDAQN